VNAATGEPAAMGNVTLFLRAMRLHPTRSPFLDLDDHGEIERGHIFLAPLAALVNGRFVDARAERLVLLASRRKVRSEGKRCQVDRTRLLRANKELLQRLPFGAYAT